MTTFALGLVETFGFVPAVEAADTAVKSADVVLSGLETIGSGLVTVKFHGDISAVKSGVQAAVAAAKRLGQVRSHTVIGRTAQGLSTIVPEPPSGSGVSPVPSFPPDQPVPATPTAGIEQPAGKEARKRTIPEDQAPKPWTDEKEKPATGKRPVKKKPDQGALPGDRKALARMRVVALRKLARTLAQQHPDFALSSEKIKFARKNELVRIISAFIKPGEV